MLFGNEIHDICMIEYFEGLREKESLINKYIEEGSTNYKSIS
jgi:hypothetical protein